MKNCCESIWRNNAQLVRLLGICPLLAVSDRLVTGLAIGLAYLAAFIWTHLIVALTRAVFPPALRGLYVAIVTACGVTLLQLTIAAYRPALAAALGVYLPVIAACCLLQSDGMGTRKGSPRDLIREGIQRGGGGLVVVGILSAIREVIGFGSVFRDLNLVIPHGPVSGLLVLPQGWGVPVVTMPAGALMVFGALLALHRRVTRV